jgi:hypothetical protein
LNAWLPAKTVASIAVSGTEVIVNGLLDRIAQINRLFVDTL